jgi:hypothetical protein
VFLRVMGPSSSTSNVCREGLSATVSLAMPPASVQSANIIAAFTPLAYIQCQATNCP